MKFKRHTIRCINKKCGWELTSCQSTGGYKCPKCGLPAA